MKKFYSLLLMTFFAISNMAYAVEPIEGVEFIPGTKEMLQKNIEDAALKINNTADCIMTRTYTDYDGQVWYGQMLNFGPNWYKYFAFEGEAATWEDVPYYEVAVVTHCNQENGVTLNWYQGVLFWPSKYALGLTEDSSLEGAEPATIDEVINSKYNGLFRTMKPGAINMYDRNTLGMINNEWFNTECVFAGYVGFIDQGSRLEISNYLKETSSIGLKWQGTWTENGAGTSSGSFAVAFDGEAFITGFEKVTMRGDFTHLHIYDFGRVDWDIYPGPLYEIDFAPVKLYRILAHNEAAEVDYGDNPAIQPANFSLNPGYEASDISYVFASAYADLNANSPIGKYTVQELLATSDGCVNNTPLPGTMMPGGYNYEFSRYDGTIINYHGNNYNIIAESVMSIGEDSFVFDGVDMYGNKWNINFPVCYIHTDNTDYSKSEEVVSGINRLFGNKAENMITKTVNCLNVTAAEDGIIEVYSTTGALVKTAKAVAGEKVSIELGNGLYIVKVGKTTTKVIM